MFGKSALKWIYVLLSASLLFALAIPASLVGMAQISSLQFTSHGHTLAFAAGGYFASTGTHDLQVQFANANSVQPIGFAMDSGSASLGQVKYLNLWEGIDLIYNSPAEAILQSTYLLQPGANPASIRLRYNAPLSVTSSGELIASFDNGQIRESAPLAWQQVNGRRVGVEVRFRQLGVNEVGFVLGAYDPAYSLTIDPITRWNTFLGGSGDELSATLVRDSSGNIYMAGSSDGDWGTPTRAYSGAYDAYIAKLDPNGNLVWNTFMGSAWDDYAYGLAVDGNGNVYVTGEAGGDWSCAPTPCTVSPYNDVDSFVARLDTDGTLVWITFSGGTGAENGSAIALDAAGNVYVSGSSTATWGLPKSAYAGGTSDAFAAAYDLNGGSIWNTFLGGTGSDFGAGIAVDGNGDTFVSGFSDGSWGSPVQAHAGLDDGFAARLDSLGNRAWNTFLGGAGTDAASAILADDLGNLYVTGTSGATWGSPVRAYSALDDGFTAGLAAANGTLNWNTFQGGNGTDATAHVVLDGNGDLFVTGQSTASWGNPVQSYAGGASDCSLAKLSSTGGLLLNSHLGSVQADECNSVAVDASGNLYLLGRSNESWGTPIRPYTTQPGNNYESFIALVDLIAPTVTSFVRQSPSVTPTNADTLTFRVTFSETMVGVDVGDFAASGTSAGILGVTQIGAGVYDVTISGGDLAAYNGMVGLNFAASPVLSDAAGNPFVAAEPVIDETYTVDNIAPAVSIDPPAPPDPSSDANAVFNFSSTDPTAAFSCDLDNTGFAACVSPKNYVGLGDGPHTFTVIAADPAGNSSSAVFHTWSIDLTPPAVQSSLRADPNPTNAASVNFTVTFTEAVTGVDITDFSLNASGVAGAAVNSVNGTGSLYIVTVDTGTGDGTIRLDLTDNDSILDVVLRPLGGTGAANGDFNTGETYTVDKENAPTALNVSNSSVAENLPAGTIVGAFTTTDIDLGDTFTYSLVSGAGSDDNAAFALVGDVLQTAYPFNYLAKNSYTIRVRTTDSANLSFETALVIIITDTPPIFADVPDSYWAVSWIERLYNNSVTGGCGASPLRYCPATNVTRAQMAIFILKSLHGMAYNPPPAAGGVFGDVPLGYWADDWIEQLHAEGITGGCGGGNYCPNGPVSREQMAVFLLRAKHGPAYTPPPATGVFADVPATHWAASWIEQLAAEGITGGCGGGNYCPKTLVNRAQMAVFLITTFNLP